MAVVLRCALPLAAPLLAAALLAGCGSSSSSSTTATTAAAAGPSLAASPARTVGAGTARFTMKVSGTLGSGIVTTYANGALSFAQRRLHVYKLVPGNPFPQEQIVDGPWTYANGNVQQAMADSRVRPWTKLDTRRLPPSQRRLEDLDHVRALAFLSGGAENARRVGTSGVLTHFRGRVDPDRVVAAVPPAERPRLRQVLRTDFTSRPFPADFWLDRSSRLRRVRVSYATPKGGRITVDGGFSGFGRPVDVKPPPAENLVDITP